MALELQNGSPLSPLCPVATPRPGQVGEALPLWFKWGGQGRATITCKAGAGIRNV